MIREGDDNGGSINGSDVVYNENMEPVLVSASDLYSKNEDILVGDSRHSSCPDSKINSRK